MLTRRGLAALALAAPMARTARAQAWPDRPLRIVVPYGPGGSNDIAARLLAQHLGEALGQPAVVENRPGAQAILGTELVAKARPDGLTLLVAASGPIVFNPATDDRLPYDPLRDLAPISPLAAYPLVLLVPAESPHRTLAELLAFARANPARANYGSPAASFQLATELLNSRAGTRFTYVAYRGSVEVANAVAAGDLSMALLDAAPTAAPLAAGRVRALAVTGSQRLPGLPAVPSFAEAGFPEMPPGFWCGLFAPAGTPAGIVERLHAEVARLVATPGYRDRMAALQSQPLSTTPAAFSASIAQEITLWRGVAQAAGLRLER